MPQVDAIIIGTGQAGPALARRLAAAGMQVAIIECDQFGGTCVNTGCTPTKTLIANAYAAHMARRASDFGVTIEGRVSVDMKKVKARKDYVVGLSKKGVEQSLRSNPKCTVYLGHGPLHLAARGVRYRRSTSRGEDLYQCRWTCTHTRYSRIEQSRLFHQQLHSERRFRAASSAGHRWQLCWPRICSDVSALWQRSDSDRDCISAHP